ncbi:MAG TPA: ERF family protein [Methanosarcinales archaeon]|nr:ERF family protein [Methanosarcinales archaeon]
MIRSESIKELAVSLAKFQAEITNPKTSAKNPQYNSKYAPLDEILALVRPVLGKQNLSIVQDVGGDLESIKITTILMHGSGEWIESEPFMLKGEQTLKGGAKVINIQGAGSMITYAKRYQVTSILGIQGAEDDDGNHASKEKKETPEEKAEREAAELKAKKICATKVETLRNMITDAKYTEEKLCEFYKIDLLEDMPIELFMRAMKSLEKMIDEQKKKAKETEEMPEI